MKDLIFYSLFSIFFYYILQNISATNVQLRSERNASMEVFRKLKSNKENKILS